MRAGLGRCSHQGDVSIGFLPSYCAPSWQETGDSGGCSQVTGDYLSCLKNEKTLVLAPWFQTFVFSAGISWITLSVPTLSTTLPQNILPPRGTSWVGVSKITLPLPSGAPSVNTSERNGPICRGGKLTTPMTSLPSSSSFVELVICADERLRPISGPKS